MVLLPSALDETSDVMVGVLSPEELHDELDKAPEASI